MSIKPAESSYYIIEASNPSGMLLYSLANPNKDDRWLAGHKFINPPSELVVAEIRDGYESADLLPYFGTPPIMSNDFYKALLRAGVDNLDVYDAVLRSEDGSAQGGNRGHYSNPRLDALLDDAAQRLDLERRRADYVEAQQILARDLPAD